MFTAVRKGITMASTNIRVKRAVIIIVSGGVMLFVSVFAGIQIGHALKDDRGKSAADDIIISGRPSTGDPVPQLTLFTGDGRQTDLQQVVSGGKTLIAFAMPGCISCTEVLSGWVSEGIIDREEGARVIVVVATPPGVFEAGDLASFASSYPMYFCDSPELYLGMDIRGLPAAMGITGDGVVSFFSNDQDTIRDTAFLRQHL